MLYEGTRATVVGLGASGFAAAKLLVRRGAKVTLNDARTHELLGVQADEARALGVTLDLGSHEPERLAQADLIVVSPGVPRLSALDHAERLGVKVVSEVELASWFIKGTIVGVTGTNGKSTVTTLVGEMCRATGKPTFVGGNLGTPLVEAVGTEAAEEGGYVVVELSSFQLERIESFRAHVGVLLNVSPDHLDRYPSFAAYAAAKGQLFARQTKADVAVAPDADALCRALAGVSPGSLALFGGATGAVYHDGVELIDRESGLRVPVAEVGIKGSQNLDNAAAAALAARMAGVEPVHVAETLRTFRGLPHRMQRVAEIAHVVFYDDSKATNVGAAVAAVQGLGREGTRVVLIAGGRDKGGSYAPLAAAVQEHGRAVITLGEAAALIHDALQEIGLPVEHASSMGDAVRLASRHAKPGDAVLLAPACASFDMFRSYAHRGEVFCTEVNASRRELV